MQNPYKNGKLTAANRYQQLHDPTINNGDDSYEMDQYDEHPAPPQHVDPHPRSSPQRWSQGNNNFAVNPDYSTSIGAQVHPIRNQQYRSNVYQPNPSHGSPYEVPWQQQNFSPVPSYQVQAPSYPPKVPWNANTVSQHSLNAEESLIRKEYGGSAPQRKPSFANSIRRYFDTESQSHLSRNNSVRNLFGLQWESTIDEYADEDGLDYQLPISGDEYQLNTWDTQIPPTSNAPAGDYAPEEDISHNYDAYNGAVGSRTPLNTWEEEDYIDGDNMDDQRSQKSMTQDKNDKELKTVELYKGNLILDCPVSTQLLQQYPDHRPVREFTHMRYTAATCDPADFVREQYTLRQMCYTQPRQTELFICVTIYNEDDILLARTLQGVFNNIRHLCHRSRSSVWGVDAWKKVVVCVVADGRDKLNPRAKALMAALGAYQEGFAKNLVNDKVVEGHIYEYTSMVRISKVTEKQVKLTTEKATPVQLMFCMKEKNKKKINSHRWFFQAFGEILRPNVCVLLDAGTRPGNRAIYHLWKSFHRDPRVAGACGEIAAMLGPAGQNLINPLVASQNFEYKMSNILDKPSESMFGFITVLPGAFSAYRYEALQNQPNGTGPLEKYFKGEKLEGKGGVFQANMYLAEDRILCWELVSKRNANWVLRYVKAAKAHTDVPSQLSELILQRRRWLNGSFFAQVYSLVHAFGIWRSGHSFGRKLAFHIQFMYQTVALLFSWFSLANFFLVFHILAAAVGDPSAGFAPGKILGIVLTWVYVACILTVFILSFGNRPQGTKRLYDTIVIFFALLMAYMIFVTIYISVKGIQYAVCANGGKFAPKLLWDNSTFRDLIVSLLATYALYLLSSLLFLDPWHVITSMLQYVLLSPVYINVMNVYAFCNTHDISWGTKGDTTQKLDLGVVRADEGGKLELELPTSSELVDNYYLSEVEVLSTKPSSNGSSPPSESDVQRDYYALFRSVNVLIWVLTNLALIAVVLNVGGFENLIGTKDSTTGTTAANTAGSTVKRLMARASSGNCQELSTGGSKESKVYMAVIFWSVAVMAAYRFILSLAYLLVSAFR